MNPQAESLISTVPPTGGCWPDSRLESLLKAALLDGDAARTAWVRWRAGGKLKQLDPASHRLLPLVYHNLRALGVDDPLMPELEGVYRYSWLRNQVLLNRGAAVLRMLHSAGIKTLLLKGAALIVHCRLDPGLRPMEDFDFLVPFETASAAAQALCSSGWQPDRPEVLEPEALARDHGVGFVNEDFVHLDLHWHVLHECLGARDDDAFWSAAAPAELQGVSTHVLHPADQLLHVCVHGVKWNHLPPVRWVADACLLLRATPNFDWDRLVSQAEQRRLILPIRDALHYLAGSLDAPVPAAVLARLASLPVTSFEEAAHASRLRPGHLMGPVATLRRHYRRYLGSGRSRGWAGFLEYLAHDWGVRRRYQLPFVALFKAARKIWRLSLWELTCPRPRSPRRKPAPRRS